MSDQFVKIVEVGPRDGLQNEKQNISKETRLEFIRLLSEAGLPEIEVGAFVSPKWVPQMACSDEILQALGAAKNKLSSAPLYSVLVPNVKGLEMALAAGAEKVAVFTAASETFSQKNTNCSIEDSLQRIQGILDVLQNKDPEHKIKRRAYLSTAFYCPYEDKIAPEKVAALVLELSQMGFEDISIGDTIGKAKPEDVAALLKLLRDEVPCEQIALHFHDTYGNALTNIKLGLEEGVRCFDSSAAGLGGCPYAPGAPGNVATEAVAKLCTDLGFETGVDLEKLGKAAMYIKDTLLINN
ncbi:MAG: hydroxymethylglutaryl-CoA lyase [Deltaproteobacteria bacterium]|nr:hydroxymethylglutaryl-CoA lyase [Deltaproteobacteria bacterium]